jgi:hypothetical protein
MHSYCGLLTGTGSAEGSMQQRWFGWWSAPQFARGSGTVEPAGRSGWSNVVVAACSRPAPGAHTHARQRPAACRRRPPARVGRSRSRARRVVWHRTGRARARRQVPVACVRTARPISFAAPTCATPPPPRAGVAGNGWRARITVKRRDFYRCAECRRGGQARRGVCSFLAARASASSA